MLGVNFSGHARKDPICVREFSKTTFETNQDVEIEKIGDTLVLRPVVKRKLTGLAEAFAAFTPGFMAEGREFHEQKERNWDDFGKGIPPNEQ